MKNIQYRYIHIIAAVFLLVGMGVQAVVSYRRATRHVQDKIDLQMQLAQEKLLFELYDAYDGVVRLVDFIEDEMTRPEDLMAETKAIIKHYPQFYGCYVAFTEYRYPDKGKWCCPCSWRDKDTIHTIYFGDSKHDYFTREWYQGALESHESGFWSHPYRDEDFDETIFTYSDDMRDKQGNLICVIASDFSLSWLEQLLDQYKPIDEAVLVLCSSDGEELAVSGQQSAISNQQSAISGQRSAVSLNDRKWLVSRKTLEPINVELVMAVPRSFVWAGIRWGIWLPFVVFVLGIIIVGVLIRRLLRDREESAKLELLQRDMQIAHDIQMGMLPKEAVRGERLAVRGERDEVEIYAKLLPARDVGGDLYDYHKEGDTLWFIIGDVSGKGVPAAMFMSATVNLFRAALGHLNSPKAIMEEMNAVLSNNNPSTTFVTAFIGRLDCQTGVLTYCNAGHDCPISIQHSVFSIQTLECDANLPVGVFGDTKYTLQQTTLEAGSTLLLYTDGLTEAKNSRREMFGEKRVTERLRMTGEGLREPQELVEDMIEAVHAFVGEAQQSDDLTLLAIRYESNI